MYSEALSSLGARNGQHSESVWHSGTAPCSSPTSLLACRPASTALHTTGTSSTCKDWMPLPVAMRTAVVGWEPLRTPGLRGVHPYDMMTRGTRRVRHTSSERGANAHAMVLGHRDTHRATQDPSATASHCCLLAPSLLLGCLPVHTRRGHTAPRSYTPGPACSSSSFKLS